MTITDGSEKRIAHFFRNDKQAAARKGFSWNGHGEISNLARCHPERGRLYLASAEGSVFDFALRAVYKGDAQQDLPTLDCDSRLTQFSFHAASP